MTVKAPFPWFGGKRRVADVVWRAFGPDVPNYIEPFAGSLAVLLGRPGGAGKIETVNDVDRYLANFWRAVAAEPEAVAEAADWPMNEADLHARHTWLVNQTEFRERMHTDPDFYDVKIAGWWVWGICQWIGGGWCVEPRHQLPAIGVGTVRGGGSGGRGVHSGTHRKLPHLAVKADGACAGRGVHSGALRGRPRPNLNTGQGIHSAQAYSPGRRPILGCAGVGVHIPSLGNDRGINGVSAAPCVDWFFQLQARLRRVRVACGDWTRVVTPSVLGKGRNVGGRRPCAVFLDPPYAHELRDRYLYSQDDASISTQVRAWAIENGDDPDLRIALCGYEGEHDMPSSWTVHAWKGMRGYAGADNENRTRERIWFSPHCLPVESQQTLFDEADHG